MVMLNVLFHHLKKLNPIYANNFYQKFFNVRKNSWAEHIAIFCNPFLLSAMTPEVT